MNATSRMHAYLDGGASRYEAWREEHLSVSFPARELRAEARTNKSAPKFPRALPDFTRAGKVIRLGGAKRP
jgi:hypothetical protein